MPRALCRALCSVVAEDRKQQLAVVAATVPFDEIGKELAVLLVERLGDVLQINLGARDDTANESLVVGP